MIWIGLFLHSFYSWNTYRKSTECRKYFLLLIQTFFLKALANRIWKFWFQCLVPKFNCCGDWFCSNLFKFLDIIRGVDTAHFEDGHTYARILSASLRCAIRLRVTMHCTHTISFEITLAWSPLCRSSKRQNFCMSLQYKGEPRLVMHKVCPYFCTHFSSTK